MRAGIDPTHPSSLSLPPTLPHRPHSLPFPRPPSPKFSLTAVIASLFPLSSSCFPPYSCLFFLPCLRLLYLPSPCPLILPLLILCLPHSCFCSFSRIVCLAFLSLISFLLNLAPPPPHPHLPWITCLLIFSVLNNLQTKQFNIKEKTASNTRHTHTKGNFSLGKEKRKRTKN